MICLATRHWEGLMTRTGAMFLLVSVVTATGLSACVDDEVAGDVADEEELAQSVVATQAADDCRRAPGEFTCSFRDPFAEGCDLDSYIVTFARDPGKVIVALRYSPSCQSAWAV